MRGGTQGGDGARKQAEVKGRKEKKGKGAGRKREKDDGSEMQM